MNLQKILHKLQSLQAYFLGLSPRWKMALACSAGTLAGLVLFLIHISNFFSYLSDSPNTCMNCHIMGPQYATWYHSSHRERASCVDCHVPHDNIFQTYAFKAMDGLRHASIFTIRGEEQAITIKSAGVNAVQKNCKRCHAESFRNFAFMANNTFNADHGKGRLCWDCHRETPHGKVRSLSSSPYSKVPTTKSMVPDWMNELMKKEK
ncbi:MAG: cytochrome c nitrite reductase small subunit [Candidatus Brocadiae bacterium]|nr:cytochrome c nitrite reductase small subunit [Candidatus Brocadiia bacterium]